MGLAEPKAAIFLNKNAHLFVFDGEEAAAGRVISVGLAYFFSLSLTLRMNNQERAFLPPNIFTLF
jgi:hypothetical protein